MLYLHEIPDVRQVASVPVAGIHYAAKHIPDHAQMYKELKRMFVNSVLIGRVPYGEIIMEHWTDTHYNTLEIDRLRKIGYNPVIPGISASSDQILESDRGIWSIWDYLFHDDHGSVERMARTHGITQEFKDFFIQHLWENPPPIITPAVQPVSPLIRAISARTKQIGLIVPM